MRHLEKLVVQFAMQEVVERVPTGLLTIEDAHSAARVATLRSGVVFRSSHGGAVDRTHRQPLG